MNALNMYRQTTVGSWTRVDMLLKLYAAAVETARQGTLQIESPTGRVESSTRTHMQRIIAQLVEGLDLSQGEVPAQVQRLLLFALQSVETDDLERWSSTTRVLTTLHDAFTAIRQEAIAAERAGEIPPLNGQSRSETLSLHG